MRTSIHIHLDDTIVNGSLNLFLGRAGAAMENKEPGTYRYGEFKQ